MVQAPSQIAKWWARYGPPEHHPDLTTDAFDWHVEKLAREIAEVAKKDQQAIQRRNERLKWRN